MIDFAKNVGTAGRYDISAKSFATEFRSRSAKQTLRRNQIHREMVTRAIDCAAAIIHDRDTAGARCPRATFGRMKIASSNDKYYYRALRDIRESAPTTHWPFNFSPNNGTITRRLYRARGRGCAGNSVVDRSISCNKSNERS